MKRRRLHYLAIAALLAGGLIWWLGPWRSWDVTIRFIGFDDSTQTRKAVFEIENQSGELLLVPKRPENFVYQLLTAGGEKSEHAAKRGGGWWGLPPGSRRTCVAPLTCPDGTPVTGPFRVGFKLTDLGGQQRMETVTKLPGWAAHWVRKAIPPACFKNKMEVHWSEVVTP